jgi:hypothetical protein
MQRSFHTQVEFTKTDGFDGWFSYHQEAGSMLHGRGITIFDCGLFLDAAL